MTATDVTGFDAIFSTGFFATFSPDFRGLVLLNYTENMEKKQNIQWRASSGDGAPKLQISVPCRGRTCPEKGTKNFNCKFAMQTTTELKANDDEASEPHCLDFPHLGVPSQQLQKGVFGKGVIA